MSGERAGLAGEGAALRVLSYGGGTQSAALALMSAAGQLPKLDAVVFADTHGELPETYEFADYVAERLADAGIPFDDWRSDWDADHIALAEEDRRWRQWP